MLVIVTVVQKKSWVESNGTICKERLKPMRGSRSEGCARTTKERTGVYSAQIHMFM